MARTNTNSGGGGGSGLEINKFTNSIEARISCYKDKASRDENLSPFAHKVFNLKLSDIDFSYQSSYLDRKSVV